MTHSEEHISKVLQKGPTAQGSERSLKWVLGFLLAGSLCGLLNLEVAPGFRIISFIPKLKSCSCWLPPLWFEGLWSLSFSPLILLIPVLLCLWHKGCFLLLSSTLFPSRCRCQITIWRVSTLLLFLSHLSATPSGSLLVPFLKNLHITITILDSSTGNSVLSCLVDSKARWGINKMSSSKANHSILYEFKRRRFLVCLPTMRWLI